MRVYFKNYYPVVWRHVGKYEDVSHLSTVFVGSLLQQAWDMEWDFDVKLVWLGLEAERIKEWVLEVLAEAWQDWKLLSVISLSNHRSEH